MNELIQAWQIFFKSKGAQSSRDSLFQKIWNLYHKRILFFIRQSAPAEADDLMQDVMLKVFENLERYNPIYSFETWIFTIARNRTINWIQKKKTRNLDEYIQVTDSVSADSGLLNSEIRRHVNAALDTLDAEHKQMVYLYYYEGLKIRQIAKVMNCPQGTVKSRLYWIRERLEQELGEFHEA